MSILLMDGHIANVIAAYEHCDVITIAILTKSIEEVEY